MPRVLILLVLVAFLGSALLLSEIRWFRRPGLADRLAPYATAPVRGSRSNLLSFASFGEAVAPLAQVIADNAARFFGVREDLATRLRRVHSSVDAAAFRVRQVGWSALAALGGATVALALTLAPPLAALVVVGAPTLTFLLHEHRVTTASHRWQRRVFLELPVIAEQLGMLTAAGYSLGAAMTRIAHRGTGCCAADLRRVTARIQQGLTETEALHEWAALAGVEALDRLVAVLAMNHETADIGRLVGDEARSIRRDAQRELIETIERRNQQVWIPVTVAALIPGVLLMSVPFADALSLFASS